MQYRLSEHILAGFATLALVTAAPTNSVAPSPAQLAQYHQRGENDYSLPAHNIHNSTLQIRAGYAPSAPQSHYTTAIIGNQLLNVFVDTGSNIFWCYNDKLPSDQLGNHVPYRPGQSPTSSQTSLTYKIDYLDGTGSSGNIWKEEVSCGSYIVNPFEIGLPTNVRGQYQDSMTCIMGLSYYANPNQPYDVTFFGAILPQLSSPVFTVDIDDGREGSFNFGYIDNSLYAGNIQWASVTDDNSWQFELTGFAINDNWNIQSTSVHVIADTGTGGISLPASIVDNYFGQVQGAQLVNGGWQFPCDATLPPLHLLFNNNQGSLTVAGDKIHGGGSGTCGSNMDRAGNNILGDAMLRSNFVVFDNGRRIGFAQKSNTNGE